MKIKLKPISIKEETKMMKVEDVEENLIEESRKSIISVKIKIKESKEQSHCLYYYSPTNSSPTNSWRS